MTEVPDYLRSPTCGTLFFASLAMTAVLTPFVMALARRVGALDTGGHRRIHEGSMPLLGGIGIFVPFIGACLVGLWGGTGILQLVAAQRPQFLALALGGLAIVALGIYDDTRGLRVRYKLLAQILIALAVVLAGEDVLTVIRLPLLGTVQLSPAVGSIVGVAWIVGLINAINIIDGIDGLAAGVSLIAAVGLLILGALGQHTFMVLLCAALAGSLIGFLPYNLHPARIFLGDTGSMFLGFALSSIALMSTYKSQTAVIVLAPLLALGFPIFETTLSMARRAVRGAPVFSADNRHTHHRLLARGYSQRKVVLLLCAVSGILTSIAIMSRIVPQGPPWEWMSLGIVLVTLSGIGWLAGYLRVVPVTTIFERRGRNAVLQAFARYAVLSLSAKTDPDCAREVLTLACRELGLRHLSVRPSKGEWAISVPGGRPPSDMTIENLRLNGSKGSDLRIEYAFDHEPDEDDRQDVAACLAQIFERADYPRRQAGVS